MQMRDDTLQPAAASRQALIAGWILSVAAILEIAAMARHPSISSSHVADVVREISDVAPLARWVHGALLALMLIVGYGFSEFVLRRGFKRPLIRAGTIAYGAGVIAMLGAAMVSGFITTDLTAFPPHATPVDLQINAQLLILCRVLNQTWAHFGALAMSGGIALWSADLLRDNGAPRFIGVLGILVSLIPALALMFGLMHLDVPGMTAIVLLQAVWNVAVGVAMIRSRI
jgi:hypothetical protein